MIELKSTLGFTSQGVDQFMRKSHSKNNKPREWLEEPAKPKCKCSVALTSKTAMTLLNYTLSEIKEYA